MGIFSSDKKRSKSPAAQANKLKRQIQKEKMKLEVKKLRDDLQKLKYKG